MAVMMNIIIPDIPKIETIAIDDGNMCIVKYVQLWKRLPFQTIKREASIEVVKIKTPSTEDLIENSFKELKRLIVSEERKKEAARFISDYIREFRTAQREADLTPKTGEVTSAPIEASTTPSAVVNTVTPTVASTTVSAVATLVPKPIEMVAPITTAPSMPIISTTVEAIRMLPPSRELIVPGPKVVELNPDFNWGELGILRLRDANDPAEAEVPTSELVKVEVPTSELTDEEELTMSCTCNPGEPDQITGYEPVLAPAERRNKSLMKRMRKSVGRLLRNLLSTKSQKFMEDTPLYTKEYVIQRMI